MKIFEKKIETDFEFFVRSLPALEPVEFLGLAKVLCVPTVRESKVLEVSKEDLERAVIANKFDENTIETIIKLIDDIKLFMFINKIIIDY